MVASSAPGNVAQEPAGEGLRAELAEGETAGVPQTRVEELRTTVLFEQRGTVVEQDRAPLRVARALGQGSG